jgi:hypothetical protein
MKTVIIHGSDEVLAPFAVSGNFIRGKRIPIRVVARGEDPDTPDIVLEGLIGVEFDAMFTREQLIEQCGDGFRDLPEGCVVAYAEEVITALERANRFDAAAALLGVASQPLDVYVLEPWTFIIRP